MNRNFMFGFGGGFMFLGAMLFVVGIVAYTSFSRFKETALPVTGVITDIEVTHTRRNGKAETHHTVHVGYEVDGAAYSGALSYYTLGMAPGQQIELLYNPANPGEMRGAGNGGMALLLFCGGGGVFLVIGGICVRIALRKRAASSASPPSAGR